eukprot:TRINITY_DN3047_c0_g1_i1.p1 TRINITY_DN3047_c0_g1~~TRINITY_DN3047_c0_g1_i1.p1  ORF type:complete len:182 (+),score=24.66 TRINITY_DN3047_c0_g1_i1:188-733(+)
MNMKFLLLGLLVLFVVDTVVGDCRNMERIVMPDVCARCYPDFTCGKGFGTCRVAICRFLSGIRSCAIEGSINKDIPTLVEQGNRFISDYRRYCEGGFSLDACQTPYYTPKPGRDGGNTPIPGYPVSSVKFVPRWVEAPGFCVDLPGDQTDFSASSSLSSSYVVILIATLALVILPNLFLTL